MSGAEGEGGSRRAVQKEEEKEEDIGVKVAISIRAGRVEVGASKICRQYK